MEIAAAGGHERVRRLEREVGEDADHVRVAAALAVAVDGGLDVADAGRHRGHGVRDGQLGVVVGVDAPGDARRVAVASSEPRTSPMIAQQLVGEGAAVRVAQHERPGAGLARGAQGRERVVAVGLVAVEEVLGVVDRLAPAIDDEADRVRDHVEVLGRRRAQDLDHVEQPRLAEDRHDRGLGRDQLLEVGVVLGLVGAVAGRAERRELGALPASSSAPPRRTRCPWGCEPGQPPSMNGIPNSSSIRATRSLSARDSVMFSPWVPSRSVVS